MRWSCFRCWFGVGSSATLIEGQEAADASGDPDTDFGGLGVRLEGIQKFLFPALGVDRFGKIGIPNPHVMAPVVGAVEIVCGAMVILGLWTRLATIPLLAVIGTAIVTTKIPMLYQQGVWAMLHEARVDFSMALGLVFLLIAGGGAFALTSSHGGGAIRARSR